MALLDTRIGERNEQPRRRRRDRRRDRHRAGGPLAASRHLGGAAATGPCLPVTTA